MNLRNPDVRNTEPKTLKVRIPLEQHIQLRTNKVLTGTAMSEVVEAALYAYFENVRSGSDGQTQISSPEEAGTS